MMSPSDDKQADIIDAFNTTSRYLHDILIINNVYFDTMLSQIYPSELQLNTSEIEAVFLDLHLSFLMILFLPSFIINDFDFEIVNFKLDLNLFRAKDFRNQNFMVTWCIN